MPKLGEENICANEGCTNIFIMKTSRDKYCSDECKKAAINSKRKKRRYAENDFIPGIKKCAYCNNEFWQKSSKHKFCSKKCARANNRRTSTSKSKIEVSKNKTMTKAIFVRRLSNDLF